MRSSREDCRDRMLSPGIFSNTERFEKKKRTGSSTANERSHRSRRKFRRECGFLEGMWRGSNQCCHKAPRGLNTSHRIWRYRRWPWLERVFYQMMVHSKHTRITKSSLTSQQPPWHQCLPPNLAQLLEITVPVSFFFSFFNDFLLWWKLHNTKYTSLIIFNCAVQWHYTRFTLLCYSCHYCSCFMFHYVMPSYCKIIPNEVNFMDSLQ